MPSDLPDMERHSPNFLRATIATAALVIAIGCGDGSDGSRFVAKGAHMGKWEDKRASGSIIMHEMLVVEEPALEGSQGAPTGSYIVTTVGPMASKINDVVTDKIPANRGMRMNFAVGNPVDVKIERMREGGKVELVKKGRASFLEIVR